MNVTYPKFFYILKIQHEFLIHMLCTISESKIFFYIIPVILKISIKLLYILYYNFNVINYNYFFI